MCGENMHVNKQIQPIANVCEKDTVEVLNSGFSGGARKDFYRK